MKKPYKSLHGLPPLAGICTMKEAMKSGLSVAECVGRLKRFHYAFKRLHEIFIARLTAEPVYELKMAFSLHAYLCAEQATALRKRVAEMREPPLGLEEIPHPGLEIFFDEIRAAPTTGELLLGLYSKAVPALRLGLESHLRETNPLADHPSVRLCRFALLEVEEMEHFGAKAVSKAVLPAERQAADDWLKFLDDCLLAAGGLAGREEPGVHPLPMNRSAALRCGSVEIGQERAGSQSGAPSHFRRARREPIRGDLPRRYSAQPFTYDPVPKRDARFPDPYNMAVNAEVFLYDPAFPPAPKTLMMFYKRLREIDVPEMMASILAQTPGKPWNYYRDMTRQLWDEARHAMMGEVGFASLGIDWAKNVMVNFTWSLALNTQLTPIERHAVLYFIEQGLMPKTGKRFEWEV